MKKILRKGKQTLSVLLAVTVALTIAPQNALSVSATEQDSTEAVVEESRQEIPTEDTGIAEAEEETTPGVGTEEESTPPAGTEEESAPPVGTEEENVPPAGTEEESAPPVGTEEESAPPTETEEENIPPVAAEEESVPPVEAEEETAPDTDTETELEGETDTDIEANIEESIELLAAEGEEVETASEAEVKVIFVNDAEHMTYKVTMGKNIPVTQNAALSNTYTIAAGENAISFTVTAANAYYRPVIKLGQTVIDSDSVKGNIYTYRVSADTISNADTGCITITEENTPRTVTLTGISEDAVTVLANIAGLAQSGAASGTSARNYTVADGDTIHFTITAQANYEIKEVKVTNRTTNAVKLPIKNKKAGVASVVSVKADADYTVEIAAEALYSVEVSAGGTSPNLTGKNQSYTVQYGTDYQVKVKHGAAYEKLQEPEMSFVKPAVTTPKVQSTAERNKNQDTVTVKIAKEDLAVKKNLELKLTTETDSHEEKITLAPLPILTGVTVKGATTDRTTKETVLTQDVNTKKSYAVTPVPSNAANTLDVKVEAEANSGITAVIEGGSLNVTIENDTPSNNAVAATIKFYDKTEKIEENKEATPISIMKIKTKLPTLKTPAAALQSADDTTLTLTLTAKEAVLPLNGNTLYYKIAAVPDTKQTALTEEQKGRLKTVTQYVPFKSATQTEQLKVIDAETGQGFAHKFNVTVTLVQLKKDKDKTLTAQAGADDILTESGKSIKNGLATKTPAYATKVTFKKGAATVYTNQTDVPVATAVFDAKATYTTLQAEVKDMSYTDKAALQVEIGTDGRQILVTADKDTAVGRHVIQVTAAGTDTMKRTTAAYTVTVARAIKDIYLTTPETIYKPDKKAAAFTTGIVYNTPGTQPQTKKVTWTITDADGRELDKSSPLGKAVSIKNGKVTIAKDYIVSALPAENEFYVTAAANDVTAYGTAKVTKTSSKITITSRSAALGEAVLVTGNDTAGYEVVARSNSAIGTDKLKGAKLVVLQKNAVDKNRYTKDEIVTAKVTYKVNNKAIVLKGNTISEVNGGKLSNVTFTVTAADGSNKKTELKKLTVNYYRPEEYGLYIYTEMGDDVGEEGKDDARERDFYGPGETALEIYVTEKNKNGQWQDLTAPADYTLSIVGSSAAMIGKDVAAGWYEILPKKETVILTLTDNTKTPKEPVTYKLTNKAYSNETAPALTKTTYNVIAGWHSHAQTIPFELKNPEDREKIQDKRVLITANMMVDLNSKNVEQYMDLMQHLIDTDVLYRDIPAEEFLDKGICINYNPYTSAKYDYTDIGVGSYKLNIIFGHLDGGHFIADAKAIPVTLKAALPKVTAKLNTSYKISLQGDTQSVPLTLNNKNAALVKTEIYNNNISGVENEFKKYFTLEDNVLKLKEDLTEEDLAYIKGGSSAAKNDRTGWVVYIYDNGSYTVRAETQITVTLQN